MAYIDCTSLPFLSPHPTEALALLFRMYTDVAHIITYSHPYECNKFDQCANRQPFINTWPSTLVRYHRNRTCDWPQNVICYTTDAANDL